MTEDERQAPPAELDEPDEEIPRGRGATVTRFFLLPLMVVAAALVIFLVFNLMTFDRHTPAEYLQEVRGGGANRRWQAAFELSRSIGRIPPGPERDALAAETLRIFEGLSPRRSDDVPVRRYLVLVLGKLQNRSAVPALRAAAGDPDAETSLYAIWSLGMLGDRGALPTVLKSSSSEDAGSRKMAAYVLGKLGDPAAIPRLKVLLEDRAPDVRWNAAIALAELGDRSGLETLRSMLDRSALARQAALTPEQSELAMVNASKAVALLKDRDSVPLLDSIASRDPNLRVREAARKSLEAISGRAATEGEARGDLHEPPR